MSEAIVLVEWSWSRLVAAFAGDEDRAFVALGQMHGLGEYEDELHRRAKRQTPVIVLAGDTGDDHGTCPDGHPLELKNGHHPNGTQRWLCRPCTVVRRARKR